MRDELIEAHARLVPELAARLTRVPDTRDELESLGWVALVRAGREFDESSGVPFEAWARLRVRGAMLDWLRSNLSRPWNRGRRLVQLDELLTTLRSDDRTLLDAEDAEALDVALRQLPSRLQRVLRLLLDGTPQLEVARVYGCSPSRVSQLVAEALTRLEVRRWLERVRRDSNPRPAD